MMTQESPGMLKPLFFGRMTRVLFGLGVFALIVIVGPASLTTLGTIGLSFLGVSFLIGGILANPGCEITAIPNLLLPKRSRAHCM